jgi:hypothetical protein
MIVPRHHARERVMVANEVERIRQALAPLPQD